MDSSKPRGFDAFCGAGGATRGYQLAGAYMVGCDLRPMPRYVGEEFVQGDALELLADTDFMAQFDFVHASPPCQAYAGVTAWRGDRSLHPSLIGPTRELLLATDRPYVIENVQDARRELRQPIRLCGSQFGLGIRRHRYFETNWPLFFLAHPCGHRRDDLAFAHKHERAYADHMRCEWMTVEESREAIPPAYTEFVGTALLSHLQSKEAA